MLEGDGSKRLAMPQLTDQGTSAGIEDPRRAWRPDEVAGLLDQGAAALEPEALTRSSCAGSAPLLARSAIAAADVGVAPETWRAVAARQAGERAVDQAVACMRSSGLWPWSFADAAKQRRGRQGR